MNLENYVDALKPLIGQLHQSKSEAYSIAARIIGKNLLKEDLCLCSMLDRSVRLTEGFISMLETRNLTCAGAILRLQLDNCLRLYALFIAEDRDKAIDCIFDGGKFNRLKSKDGKKMLDAYLKNELVKYDAHFASVYDQASGYIHFSCKSLYQSTHPRGDYKIEFQVGGELPEKINPILLECCNAYIHYLKLFFNLMEPIAEAKAEFDAKYNG